MKILQQPAARQPMQNAERKSRAPDSAAGNTERGLFFFQPMDGAPNRAQLFAFVGRVRIRGRRLAVNALEFFFEHAV